MRILMSKILVVVVIIHFQPTNSFSQDSLKIILSSRVGISIDPEERDHYKLFKNFDGFKEAIVYQGTDSLFYYKILYSPNALLKDTTIEVSYGLLINWAARIESIGLLKEGDKNFNPASVKLYYANGKVVPKPREFKEYFRTPLYDLNTKLPLSKIKIDNSNLTKDDFEGSISFGIIHNSSTFDGLGHIFNLLEEAIPESPYLIPKSDFTFNATPLFSFAVSETYKNMIKGEIEYNFSINNDDYSTLDYKSFTISISYLYQLSQLFLPYISAGYMGYDFEVVKDYPNILINSTGRLKSITIQGKAKGPVFGFGVMLDISQNIRINLFGRYKLLGNPTVEESQLYNKKYDFNTNINTNGIETGVSLIIK